jgi:hypothetical protein
MQPSLIVGIGHTLGYQLVSIRLMVCVLTRLATSLTYRMGSKESSRDSAPSTGVVHALRPGSGTAMIWAGPQLDAARMRAHRAQWHRARSLAQTTPACL